MCKLLIKSTYKFDLRYLGRSYTPVLSISRQLLIKSPANVHVVECDQVVLKSKIKYTLLVFTRTFFIRMLRLRSTRILRMY